MDPSRHARDRNPLESVLRKIPGFRGYLEKEYRRESDELQRQWLAARLEVAKRSLDRTARTLVDAGQLDVLPQIDRLRGHLDKLLARIRGAMQGYSGIFDLVQINTDVLEQVYSHDASLIDQVEELATAVEQVPADAQKITAAIAEVRGKIDAIELSWDERERILRGVSGTALDGGLLG